MTKSTDKLEGTTWVVHDEASRHEAIHRAFDYRGDITIVRTDGGRTTGYLFDYRLDGLPFVRLYVANQHDPVCLSAESIAEIHLTGRDAAEGKSWESWLHRVSEAEARGEIAELYPDEI